jgi:hypothetical protein
LHSGCLLAKLNHRRSVRFLSLSLALLKLSSRMPLITVPPRRQTSRREELQVLVEQISNQLGSANTRPKEDNVADSWKVLKEYVDKCLEIHSPQHSQRPDWQTVATAEAHFESFRWTVLTDDRWAEAFPLGEFCRAWEDAEREFYDELSGTSDL